MLCTACTALNVFQHTATGKMAMEMLLYSHSKIDGVPRYRAVGTSYVYDRQPP